jgi:3'-5' exoribonuclease
MNGEPFPQEHKDALMHLILSHHGEVSNGWGSVVNPNTPEAIVLHYADLLDSRSKGKLQEQL